MAVDLFRLGVAAVLLGSLFPLIEFTSEYVNDTTAAVTLILWLIGIILIVVSAFTGVERPSS